MLREGDLVLGLAPDAVGVELWTREPVRADGGTIALDVPAHGVRLLRFPA